MQKVCTMITTTNRWSRAKVRLGLINFFTNPIIVKELRGYWRDWHNMVMLVSYLVSLSFLGVGSYFVLVNDFSTSSKFSGISAELVGSYVFGVIIVTQIVMAVSTCASSCSSSIVSEKERQNYDVLLITLLKPRQIVVGKLMVAVIFTMLLTVAGLPVLAMAFLVGGVSLDQIIVGLILCLVSALLGGSIGLYYSSRSPNTKRATAQSSTSVVIFLLIFPFVGFFAHFDIANWTLISYVLMSISAPVAMGYTIYQLDTYPALTPNIFVTQIYGYTVPMPWLICIVINLIYTFGFLNTTVRWLKPTGWSLGFMGFLARLMSKPKRISKENKL